MPVNTHLRIHAKLNRKIRHLSKKIKHLRYAEKVYLDEATYHQAVIDDISQRFDLVEVNNAS